MYATALLGLKLSALAMKAFVRSYTSPAAQVARRWVAFALRQAVIDDHASVRIDPQGTMHME